jgi:arsenical pump membrane protein
MNGVDRARRPTLGAFVVAAGAIGVAAALSSDPGAARSAASQVWPPFVLVAGLLLVGGVAEEDGLFRAAGYRLARLSADGRALFFGGMVLVVAVTAVLNLDTAVVFLTPVLVHAARSRSQPEAPLLYGTLLLANAGSLPLPGSNLTNLIVIGHGHLSGTAFFTRLGPSWLAAVVVTTAVLALLERRSFTGGVAAPAPPPAARFGVGVWSIVATVVLVLVLRSPALPVALVGVAAASLRILSGRLSLRRALDRLALPFLVGLFAVAVSLGTLGRAWGGPAQALAHLDTWATAAVAAGAGIVVNNLPAASMLASRTALHPGALLIGLDVGPNLFVTGSLAWLLWLGAARGAGARPSVKKACLLGVSSAPVAMAAAVAALSLGAGR